MSKGNGREELNPDLRSLYDSARSYNELQSNPKADFDIVRRQAASVIDQYRICFRKVADLPKLKDYIGIGRWEASNLCYRSQFNAFMGALLGKLEGKMTGRFKRE